MNETISDKQAVSIIFLSTLGSSVVLGTARPAKRDAWLSIIIALIVSLIITLCYARLSSNFHGKNLFEICEIIFGKIIGKVITLIYTWYSLYIVAFVIRDISEFIYIVGIVNIREVSEVFTMTTMMLLCIYMTKKDMSVLGRFCTFFLPIVVFMLCIGYLLSINNMNPKNLLPIMYDGIEPVLSGTISSISFPFTESIVFLMIFTTLQNKASSSKIITKGVLYSGLLLFAITICDLMILGPNALNASYFPSYTSLKRISIGHFLERIEVTIILSFIFGVFVKSTCFLIAASKGVACLFNLKDYSPCSTPLGFLSISIAYSFYENTREMVEIPGFTDYHNLVFQILLFFIIFIGGEIKIRKMKKYM